jgi:hypothetical protein
MLTEHILVWTMTFLRCVNFLIFYKLEAQIGIATITLVAGLPYLCISWIYLFVLFAWASIYYSSEQKTSNPFQRFKPFFIAVNTGISATFAGLFITMASKMSATMTQADLDAVNYFNNVGTAIISVVLIGFAVFFVIYGKTIGDSAMNDDEA